MAVEDSDSCYQPLAAKWPKKSFSATGPPAVNSCRCAVIPKLHVSLRLPLIRKARYIIPILWPCSKSYITPAARACSAVCTPQVTQDCVPYTNPSPPFRKIRTWRCSTRAWQIYCRVFPRGCATELWLGPRRTAPRKRQHRRPRAFRRSCATFWKVRLRPRIISGLHPPVMNLYAFLFLPDLNVLG